LNITQIMNEKHSCLSGQDRVPVLSKVFIV
jgi:hypothetical protein